VTSSLLALCAFTVQSDIADQMAANTRRMGTIPRLHMAAMHSILADVQRARLCALAPPNPPNRCRQVHLLAGACAQVPSRGAATRGGR
jgi:hypothetical protein